MFSKMNFILIVLVFLFARILPLQCNVDTDNIESLVTYLDFNREFYFEPPYWKRSWNEDVLRVYCFDNPMYPWRLFETVSVEKEIATFEYTQYIGRTPEEIYRDFKEDRKMCARIKLVLPGCQDYCFGLHTKYPYTLKLTRKTIDYERVSQLMLGVVICSKAALIYDSMICLFITVNSLLSVSLLVLMDTLEFNSLTEAMVNILCYLNMNPFYLVRYLLSALNRNCINEYAFFFALGVAAYVFFLKRRILQNRYVQLLHYIFLRVYAAMLIYFSSDCHIVTGSILVGIFSFSNTRYFFQDCAAFYRGSRPPPRRKYLTKRELVTRRDYTTQTSLGNLRKQIINVPLTWKTVQFIQNPQMLPSFLNGGPDTMLTREQMRLFRVRSEQTLNHQRNTRNNENGSYTNLYQRNQATMTTSESMGSPTNVRYRENYSAMYSNIQSPSTSQNTSYMRSPGFHHPPHPNCQFRRHHNSPMPPHSYDAMSNSNTPNTRHFQRPQTDQNVTTIYRNVEFRS